MRHRCNTERNAVSDTRDAFNQPVTELRDINTDLPCYWQVRTEQLVLDGDKVATVALHRMLAPIGSNLREQDRVTSIHDRLGRTLNGNTMRILTMIRREDHLELALEEVA